MRTHLSPNQVNVALSLLLPPGFRVHTEYLIETDSMVIRVHGEGRNRYVDLQPSSDNDLYMTPTEFCEAMRESVETAIKTLSAVDAADAGHD